MRKLAITAALASTVLATPAVARDGSGYVGVNIGPMLVQDTEFDYIEGPLESVGDAFIVDHVTGVDGDLVGGYDLGMFRIEGELSHKRADIDDVEFAGVTGLPQSYYDNYGSARVTSLMANALLDYGDDDGWSGFVGGGVGGARVRYAMRDLSVRDNALAWQLLAGVRASVNRNVDFGLKYRYFNTRALDFGFGDDVVDGGKFRSHSLLAGITYNFVAPAAPVVAPVVEAPPPPPPATQTCPDGSVILATDACPVPPPPPPAPPGERG
jgi:opacity protein-like surface antigen